MAFKLIQSALTTSTEALYMFAADTVDDLKNLPNLERAGEETNIRWFAKVGSCVRVIGAGRWYVLSPSNVWCPLFYMSTEVEDAVEHNVETMRQIMSTTEGYKTAAANSAAAAAKSEKNAADSKTAAATSEKNAKASETAAKNSEDAAKESEVLSGKNQIAAADAAEKAEAVIVIEEKKHLRTPPLHPLPLPHATPRLPAPRPARAPLTPRLPSIRRTRPLHPRPTQKPRGKPQKRQSPMQRIVHRLPRNRPLPRPTAPHKRPRRPPA